MVEILPLAEIAPDAVDLLLDAAFGTDRHTRTAYAMRLGTRAIPALSFAAVADGRLIGSVQSWPVALTADAGDQPHSLVMVGPVAVMPAQQRSGTGRMLMTAQIAAALSHADAALMMIGDPEYYGRFFGFTADATVHWRVPGPVDPRRLLARGVNGHNVPDVAGMIGPLQRS